MKPVMAASDSIPQVTSSLEQACLYVLMVIACLVIKYWNCTSLGSTTGSQLNNIPKRRITEFGEEKDMDGNGDVYSKDRERSWKVCTMKSYDRYIPKRA